MNERVPYLDADVNTQTTPLAPVSRAAEMRSFSFAKSLGEMGQQARRIAEEDQAQRGAAAGRRDAAMGTAERRSNFTVSGRAYNAASAEVVERQRLEGIMLDQQRRGSEEGIAAALNGQFKLRDGYSVRDQSFNRAGAEATIARIDGESTAHIMELSRKHYGDPAGFEKAVQSYALGIRRELLPVAPQGAVELSARIGVRALQYRERLSQQYADRARDASEAQLLRYDAQMGALLDDVSGDLFSDNAELSRIAVKQLETLANQALVEYSRVDADGQPLYTEVEREQAHQEFLGRAVEEGLVKWFRSVEDLPAAIMRFRDGELQLALGDTPIDVSATLGPEARARVLRVAAAELTQRNAMAEDAEKAAEDAVKATQSANYYRATVRFLGRELTMADVQRMWDARELNDDDAIRLQTALMDRLEAPPETDHALTTAIMESLYVLKEDPTNYILANAGQISADDMARFLATANKLFAPDTGDGTRYNAYQKREMDLLGQALGTAPELFAMLDFGQKQRVYAAMSEFQIRVDEGEDARTVRQELVERARQPDANAIVNPTTTLLQPTFAQFSESGRISLQATIRATMAAFEAGQISEAQRNRQLALIKDWALAYEQIDGAKQ